MQSSVRFTFCCVYNGIKCLLLLLLLADCTVNGKMDNYTMYENPDKIYYLLTEVILLYTVEKVPLKNTRRLILN